MEIDPKEAEEVWQRLCMFPPKIDLMSYAVAKGVCFDATGIGSRMLLPSTERTEVAKFFRCFADAIEKGV